MTTMKRNCSLLVEIKNGDIRKSPYVDDPQNFQNSKHMTITTLLVYIKDLGGEF